MTENACIGIDLGGTKIEGLLLSGNGREILRKRVATPRQDYQGTIRAICQLVFDLTAASPSPSPAQIGIAMPGSIPAATGLVQNANSTWLNGRPFSRDLEAALGRQVRIANDANCFALSEATDGAGAGAASVFGVILGTGCGGGVVINGTLVDGPRNIGGEWGHTPLPWALSSEHPGPECWCGRRGCLETWVAGPALERDFREVSGVALSAEQIAAQAAAGDNRAIDALERHASRLARGLAMVVNILDPEVIVLGGGLSKLGHLYVKLPDLVAPHVFSDLKQVDIRPPIWGDASGVRGAARLWHAPARIAPYGS